MFKGRKLLIASKHEKERVIAPLVIQALGIKEVLITDFDTDTLGTFSGEIVRTDDPITTIRNKCLKAMELSDCDLAIANEGSFGPHPSFFFCAANEEFILLIDKKNNLEIIERVISTETNFDAKTIISEEELLAFCDKVKFPSHAVILRPAVNDYTEIFKGIQDIHELREAYKQLISNYATVYIETDMRAHKNPSRMKVIEDATKKLIKKIQSTCPNCSIPGFGITDAKVGLPCQQCHLPTKSTLSYIYACLACGHQQEKKYPHAKTWEDPMYCDFCNP
jgi:hypothetical protein